ARWEFGHLVGFVLSLVGFSALAIGMIRDLPSESPHVSAPSEAMTGGPHWRRLRGPASA
ncbi:MAG: hypothetical protein HOV81_02430, partial [Kofleriaceae bacterium]|nr:hypothetical protein [Kofleriaceae bacterium]